MHINKESKALLREYKGPLFPTGMGDLNKIYYAIWEKKSGFMKMLKTIIESIRPMDCFQGRMYDITTSDNYSWLDGLHFLLPNGELMILLPRPYDWHRRSIAVYTKGTPVLRDAEILLERIGLRFYKIWKKKIEERLQKIIDSE